MTTVVRICNPCRRSTADSRCCTGSGHRGRIPINRAARAVPTGLRKGADTGEQRPYHGHVGERSNRWAKRNGPGAE